jgi:hypothetical protein
MTPKPTPDFRQMYYYSVMSFAAFFFCLSIFFLIGNISTFFIPQNTMFQDSYSMCKMNYPGMGMPNSQPVTRSKAETDECIQENDKRQKLFNETNQKNGLVASTTGLVITTIAWTTHYRMSKNYSKEN